MNICATDIKMEIGNNEILKGVSIDSKNRCKITNSDKSAEGRTIRQNRKR